METPETIRTSLHTGEWVTSIDFKDAYFQIPIQNYSRKYLRFTGHNIPVQGTALWSVHSPTRAHCDGERGQSNGLSERYKDPAVPRRVVGLGQVPPNLSPTYTSSSKTLAGPGFDGKHGQIRTGSQTGFFNFVSYQFDLRGQYQTHPRQVTVTDSQKTSPPRPSSYATNTVASQRKLEGPRVTRKHNSCLQVTPPQLKVVAGRKQCATRSTITPLKHVLQVFTYTSKEGSGTHLNDHPARGT